MLLSGPLQGGWQPRALARFALESSGYSPINYLGSVTAPVMFVTALQVCACLLLCASAGGQTAETAATACCCKLSLTS